MSALIHFMTFELRPVLGVIFGLVMFMKQKVEAESSKPEKDPVEGVCAKQVTMAHLFSGDKQTCEGIEDPCTKRIVNVELFDEPEGAGFNLALFAIGLLVYAMLTRLYFAAGFHPCSSIDGRYVSFAINFEYGSEYKQITMFYGALVLIVMLVGTAMFPFSSEELVSMLFVFIQLKAMYGTAGRNCLIDIESKEFLAARFKFKGAYIEGCDMVLEKCLMGRELVQQGKAAGNEEAVRQGEKLLNEYVSTGQESIKILNIQTIKYNSKAGCCGNAKMIEFGDGNEKAMTNLADTAPSQSADKATAEATAEDP